MYRLGVDLGTTFSVASVFNEKTGEVRVLSLDDGASNEEQGKLFPSVIMWDAASQSYVYGWKAYRALQRGKSDVVATFKRAMGKNERIYSMNGRDFTGEELSEMLLRRIRERACEVLGENVDTAVITVPAYFMSNEKRATRDAGRRAGFKNIIRVVNEPTAAAITYCSGRWKNGGILLMFDLGGGTFDVTLCRMSKGYTLEVLASEGDSRLGGKDWDAAAAALFIQRLEEAGADVQDERLVQEVRSRSEELKKAFGELSEVSETFEQGGVEYNVSVTGSEFEEATKPLLLKCEGILKKVMDTARSTGQGCASLDWIDVDDVLLVGGSTRLNRIKEMIERVTGHEPVRNGIDPDKVVSAGAAIDAYLSHDSAAAVSMGKGEIGAAKKSGGNEPLTPGTRISTKDGKNIVVVRPRDKTAHSLGVIAVSPDHRSYICDVVIPAGSSIPAKHAIGEAFHYNPGDPEMDHMDVYTVQNKSEKLQIADVERLYRISGFPGAGQYEVHIQYMYDESGISDVQARLKDDRQLTVMETDRPADMTWIYEPPVVRKVGGAGNRVVMLSIDVSGSMTTRDAGANHKESRVAAAREAMHDFVNKLSDGATKIGVIATASSVKTVLEPTADYQAVQRAIDTACDMDLGGGSSAHPFGNAWNSFSRESGKDCMLIILADGEWYGDAPAGSKAGVARFREAGYRSIAIGFGTAKWEFLRSISTSGEDAILTSGSKLMEAFGSIAVALRDGSSKNSGNADDRRHVVETW